MVILKEQNKVLESLMIIINYCIIIIMNSYYNYIISAQYNYICLINASSRNAKRKKMWK